MRKEIFETGKSVDLAIDRACEKLECLREDCEWEIIDLPKKGFLGLKNTPAKVRVSIEIPDEKPAEQPRQQKPEPARPRIKPEPKAVEQRKPLQRSEPDPEAINPEDISEKEAIAKAYLSEMLEALGLKADFVVTREHGGSCINIIGESLGMIIGRRGETLDAIQYLTGLVANRGEGDYMRLTVDCGDYRLKRKDTLEALAKKLAAQVLKTNVSKTLEPMNPFERRIIHATVSELEGVSSASVGEEPNRRVVITSPGARPASRGGYRTDRRGGYNRTREPYRDGGTNPVGNAGEATGAARPPRPAREDGERDGRYNRGSRSGRDDFRRGGSSRGPRPSTPVQSGPPKQTPESETTTGISFGKIDLD